MKKLTIKSYKVGATVDGMPCGSYRAVDLVTWRKIIAVVKAADARIYEGASYITLTDAVEDLRAHLEKRK